MEEQRPVIETTQSAKPWRFALTGCMSAILFLVVLLVGISAILYRAPLYHDMAGCTLQIKSIQEALERYSIKNDSYPDRLEQIVPDYLSRNQLHCPADKSAGNVISYVYHKPAIDAPPDTVILECSHHKARRLPGPWVVFCSKGGSTGVRAQQ